MTFNMNVSMKKVILSLAVITMATVAMAQTNILIWQNGVATPVESVDSITFDYSGPVPQPDYVDLDINGVNLRMMRVAGGTFYMGAQNEDPEAPGYVDDYTVGASESPVHQVTVTDFYMAETECTQALWQALFPSYDYFVIKGANKPCNGQQYGEMLQFIDALNKYAHDNGVIPQQAEFVLPSEAQWEWAARGGVKSHGYRYAGSDDCSLVAWTSENSDETLHDVKQLQPNELGLYDMSGNAYEAVSDNFSSNYAWAADGEVDPTGKPSEDIAPGDMGYGQHMRRSSGYMAPAWRATVTKRSMYDHSIDAGNGASTDMSFRLVMVL